MKTPTADRIAELAHEMIQIGGYGELHYGEIAQRLNVTRAAVHHYYPNKIDLATRVIQDYCTWTEGQLASIMSNFSESERLKPYIGLYRSIIESGDQLLCPGGMLAAEAMVLPDPLRPEVRRFFDIHVRWAEQNLFNHDLTDAHAKAIQLVSGLQGALLLARLYGSVQCFDTIAAGFIDREARMSSGAGTGT